VDVKTTFLYGDLDETIYIKKPKGFEIEGKKDYVCKFNKSLFDLKQSPRKRNKQFDEFIARISFERIGLKLASTSSF